MALGLANIVAAIGFGGDAEFPPFTGVRALVCAVGRLQQTHRKLEPVYHFIHSAS
jgi:hypothetical protein